MDIGKKIVDALVTQITLYCQTNIDISDPTRVEVINRGRFQDDLEDAEIVVAVHRNEPDTLVYAPTTDWPDEQEIVEMGMIIGSYGSGASEHWKRRFCVEVRCWPQQDQEIADEINGIVMARLRQAINCLSLDGVSDDFGESVTIGSAPIRRMRQVEGGGPDTDYSWAAFLYLEYQTTWKPI